MQHQISAKVGQWINKAIDTHGHGENIGWESLLMPMPTGPGQEPIPMLTVFVWFPGAVLGTTLNGSFQIGDPLGVDEQWIDHTVSQMLAAFREARNEQMQQMPTGPAQQPEGPLRGTQTASGLLIP